MINSKPFSLSDTLQQLTMENSSIVIIREHHCELLIRKVQHQRSLYSDTGRQELRKTSKPVVPKRLSSKRRPVLLVKRIMASNGQYQRTEIDILSEHLLEVLKELNKDVQGLSLTARPTVQNLIT